MTATTDWRAPWVGRCTGCFREGITVAPRPERGERVLCDRCAPASRTQPAPPSVPQPFSKTNLVPRSSFLVPDEPPCPTARQGSPCPIDGDEPPCPTSSVDGDDEPEVEGLLKLYRAGRLRPVAVQLAVPDQALPVERRVAQFFGLVHGLRLAAGDDRPVPFACRWVGAQLSLPRQTVSRTLHSLVDDGVLRKCPPLPGRQRRGTATFLPEAGRCEGR